MNATAFIFIFIPPNFALSLRFYSLRRGEHRGVVSRDLGWSLGPSTKIYSSSPWARRESDRSKRD